MGCDDSAGGFMPENVIICHYHGSNGPSMPEVNIRPVTCQREAREETGDSDPQMPVLLMATVTHPSGRSSPFLSFRALRLGVVSSIHSLWSALVKTPMFGLVIVSTVVVVDIVKELLDDRCVSHSAMAKKKMALLARRLIARAVDYPTVNRRIGGVCQNHQYQVTPLTAACAPVGFPGTMQVGLGTVERKVWQLQMIGDCRGTMRRKMLRGWLYVIGEIVPWCGILLRDPTMGGERS